MGLAGLYTVYTAEQSKFIVRFRIETMGLNLTNQDKSAETTIGGRS